MVKLMIVKNTKEDQMEGKKINEIIECTANINNFLKFFLEVVIRNGTITEVEDLVLVLPDNQQHHNDQRIVEENRTLKVMEVEVERGKSYSWI